MSPQSAYRLRKAPGAEDFAKAWDIAWDMGVDKLSETAIDRAMNGQECPIVYRGTVVGKVHKFDNRLAIRALAFFDGQAERWQRNGRRW